ncbi:unnamed protein product, partial [marine sediment metagenome]
MLTRIHPENRAAINKISASQLCGKGCVIHINEETGTTNVIPLRCKTWSCHRCSKTLRNRWIRRIIAAKPERWMTLTMPPAAGENTELDFRRMQDAWEKLVVAIRIRWGKFQYVAIREIQKRGKGEFRP